ncbi:hypothetical protein DPMN_055757 [Dreissena polymorpha]|uniref:Uncharacterized protein n=1 Tax=Dreissena polymorpha TaxID=45954 RepID=A0A9D4CS68_DREPO|nr:hypothetical protein DPMN_055757 [Dreissena polymorpha]
MNIIELKILMQDKTNFETSNGDVEAKVEDIKSETEVMKSLDQRLCTEDNERQTCFNSEDMPDEAIERNRETPVCSDHVSYAEMNKTKSYGSNVLGNTETQSDCIAEPLLEEPNPDYDTKKNVCFSEPLKVTDEAKYIREGDDTSNMESNENGYDEKGQLSIKGDELENNEMHNKYNPTKDLVS